MVHNSIRPLEKAVQKIPGILATFCALAVLTLTLSTGRAAVPEVSPAATPQDDGVIQEQVYDALDTDPMHYFRHVDVHVQGGVVTLSGFVWSTASIYRAEKVVSGVPGVTHVIDRIELQRNGLAPHA